MFVGRERASSDRVTDGAEAIATSYTYTNAYTGKYTSDLIHHVTIGNLDYSTDYEYFITRFGCCPARSDPGQCYRRQFSNFLFQDTTCPWTRGALRVCPDWRPWSNQRLCLHPRLPFVSINTVINLCTDHILSDSSMEYTLLVGDLSYADSEGKTSAGTLLVETTSFDTEIQIAIALRSVGTAGAALLNHLLPIASSWCYPATTRWNKSG